MTSPIELDLEQQIKEIKNKIKQGESEEEYEELLEYLILQLEQIRMNR